MARSCRFDLPPRRLRPWHNAGTAGAMDVESHHRPICDAANAQHFARHGRDGQRVQGLIEHQFKAADVTAVHAVGFRHVAVVGDLGLAGGALPRHRWRAILGWNQITCLFKKEHLRTGRYRAFGAAGGCFWASHLCPQLTHWKKSSVVLLNDGAGCVSAE